MTTCVFCDKVSKGSREHVFGKWIPPILRADPRGFPEPTYLRKHTQAGVRSFPSGGALGLSTRRVCKKCNETWMSLMEDSAKPIIGDLMKDHARTLSLSEQAAVASWAAKTVMTGSLAMHQPIGHGWLSYLYKHHSPPPGWQVWIGRYVGSWPLVCEIHDIDVQSNDPLLSIEHGVLATIVLGYFVIKVLGIHHPDAVMPFPQDLQPVWRPVAPGAPWPPAHSWTDSSLQQLIDLFFFTSPERAWSP